MSPVLHLELGVAADTTITVSRTSANADRPQGLVLDADHPLRVGEHEATRIVLWSTTAPDIVEVHTTGAGTLRLWNVWRDGDLVQAWQGAAGIALDDDGDDLGLVCSDGHEGSTRDQVMRLAFDRSWTQPADD